MITAERLRELLHYDPDTGVFRWRVQRNQNEVGSVAGGHRANGYIGIKVDRRNYVASHLAWLYVYGRWPKDKLDHRNRIRNDDRIDNLREASNRENLRNASRYKRSASGFKGVSKALRKSGKHKWQAMIMLDSGPTYLGCFDTPEAAHAAYCAAAKEHFGEFFTPG